MKRFNKLKQRYAKFSKLDKGIKATYIIAVLIVPPFWEFGGAFSSMIVGIFGIDEADLTSRFFLSYPIVFSLCFIIQTLIKIKDKIIKK